MHPLMYGSFLPDSRQVSREAAERHAMLTRRPERTREPRTWFAAFRAVPQS